MGEEKKTMSLDYITINGLDPIVRAKMEEDLKRTGYSGTKSAYVTQLCSEALDARARRSELTTQKDVDSLSAKMDAMSAELDALANEFGKEKAESEIYRMLFCECYHALEMILATQGGDVDVMRFFRKGWYNNLPENLSAKMDEVRRSLPTPNVLARIHYYEPGSDGRDFYSSNKKDDYLNYIDKGIKSDKIVRDYMDYAGNEEKSSGLFWANGMLSDSDKKELRKKLRMTDSCIWDLVVSFEEGYGLRNVKDASDAMEMLRSCLPKLFKGMNIDPDNVIWAAGLHTNTAYRHCHIFFFEKDPTFYDRKTKGRKYRRGKVSLKTVEGFKMSIEKHFLEPMQSSKRARAIALEETRNAVTGDSNKDDTKLESVLMELYAKIPAKGRISYESESMDAVRPLVDSAVSLIEQSPSFQTAMRPHVAEMEKRDANIRDICYRQKLDPKPYLYVPKFEEDLHRRMANEIIRLLVSKRNEEAELLKSASHPKQAQRIKARSAVKALEEASEL